MHTSFESALQAIETRCATPSSFVPIVIKADGPAAGKGVIIAHSLSEATEALQEIFMSQDFGSQTKVVLEELLQGPEFSFFTLVQGSTRIYLPCAQDFKRQGTGDTGLNTGGMGAYTPVPFVTKELLTKTIDEIVEPTLSALEQEGAQFNGVLYTGLMLTDKGPKVIEFNARFGDPETQAVTAILDEDLAVMIDALLKGKETMRFARAHGACVGVVVAADGYPKAYMKGISLRDFENPPASIELVYAGVSRAGAADTGVSRAGADSGLKDVGDGLVSAGGRILMALAQGNDIREARARVYDYLDGRTLSHMFYRKDIALKAVEQLGKHV